MPNLVLKMKIRQKKMNSEAINLKRRLQSTKTIQTHGRFYIIPLQYFTILPKI